MTMQSLSTTTTELKPVELQSYLDEGWRIFVDTCSFMSSGCEPFFTRSAAAFRDAGVSIHCPKEVRRELEKNLSSPKEQTRQLAMRGLAAYDALDKLDVLREIDCPGSQENVFADPVSRRSLTSSAPSTSFFSSPRTEGSPPASTAAIRTSSCTFIRCTCFACSPAATSAFSTTRRLRSLCFRRI